MTDKVMRVENSQRPSIAYVDEVKDERDNFFADAFYSNHFETIHLLHPEPNLQDMVNELLSMKIDALVTDFNLSEASPLSYDGEMLVSAFLEARSDFPCFIRTSYDEDALASSEDVNRVYSKNISDDENVGRYLFKRIAQQIEHHKQRVSNWQNELSTLLDISASDRTAKNLDRILELDTKIEASLGNDAAIPMRVKAKLFDKESELISETERLVADIKRALGE